MFGNTVTNKEILWITLCNTFRNSNKLFRPQKSVFSGSDVIVNRAQVLDIIDRMRAVYPDVMRQAQFIVDDCENQKQRVLEYGNNVIKEAESRRDKLLNESDIIRQATEEAAKSNRKPWICAPTSSTT